MGRVIYMRHIVPAQLEAYEALGWTFVGGKYYALDNVSVTVSWEHEGEPVEPRRDDMPDGYQPAPIACSRDAVAPWGTREVVRWNFAPFDLVWVIALALAGLFWGLVDKVRGR